MALGRVKSWVGGEVLTANDLNAEFNNILNNPVALISPTTGVINFNLAAHTGLVPGVITGTSGSTGQPLGVLQSGAVGFVNVGQAVSRVSGLIGSLSSQSGTFSADGYVMRSSSALAWYVTATSAFAASVGTAGPASGGRDKAAVFASTEVHWYAITTGPGSTAPAGLVSSQAPPTGPVLPAGYAGWTYLGGSAYTSASTTVAADHAFRGHQASYHAAPTILSGGTSTSEVVISVSSAVPANVTYTRIHGDLAGATAAQAFVDFKYLSGLRYQYLVTAGVAGARDSAAIDIPGRTLIYNQDTTNGSVIVRLLGYTMPNGDV